MHMSLDPFLVDKVVAEVKSQGVFDQFRRDSMSDVDTKPAYQNLRQRVETTVTKFLDGQKWTPELNKNQLREKLRKHITETGILDTGVDRIVEQVVNPKVITVFQPKIEDIAYNYLGIEKPEIKVEETPPNFTNGDLSIKTDFLPTDLEAVSPDSDKATEEKYESKEDLVECDDKNEEFESPPFEPLEGLEGPEKKEDSNHSQLSGISGLTSQDSMDKADISLTNHNDATQESNLSAVSSNSQLSIVTNGNDDSKCDIKEEANVGISEEAQMPKFADNSSADVSNKDLHFDIKKEEIKFEGTEWKSEKPAYFSGIKENLTVDTNTAKTEFEQTSTEQDMSSKVEEISASSNLTYSTDTQNSAMSKPGDFDKCEKENSKNPEAKCDEKDKVAISENKDKSPEIDQAKYSSKSKESDAYHKKTYKKSVDKEKSSSGDSRSRNSDSRNDSHSPRAHSSSRKHKSSNDHHRSKSSSHKRKRSRTRDRSRERSDKSRDKKHRSDKDKNGKKLENCSERNKKYRRKSTDSNDDPTGSKDTSKNTSPSSMYKNGSGKEILNSSSSSSFSGSTNGSVEAALTAKKHAEMILANASTHRKPVILDNLLSSTARGNVELVIGSKVMVNDNEKNDNTAQHDEDLKYFEQDPVEEERCLAALERLSKFLSSQKLSYIYLYYCNEGYKKGFAKQCNKVIDIGFDKLDIYFTSDNIQNNKGKNLKKKSSSNKSNNEKSKSSDDNFYHGAYQVFTDDKIENNRSSLIIDCFEYNVKPTAPKKLKTHHNFELDSFPKISPTPSDMSAGSKENDCVGKKTSAKSSEKSEAEALKRSIAFKNSQRYSSEDLYKPRPILGQRSRRRAIEAEGI